MHKGSCHCGKIAYEFDGEIGPVLDCNCSLCQKRGGLLHFVPGESFRLTTPRSDLETYMFNKHVIAHHFCGTCGVSPFSEGKNAKGETMVAVNARCLEDADPRQLDVKFHNGRTS